MRRAIVLWGVMCLVILFLSGFSICNGSESPGRSEVLPMLCIGTDSSCYVPPVYSKFKVELYVLNRASVPAPDTSLNITLPEGVMLVSGSLNNNLGTIPPDGRSSYVTLWLRATTPGDKVINMSTSSYFGGQWWYGSASVAIYPLDADTIPPDTIGRITGPAFYSGGGNLVENGDFETSLTTGWTSTGDVVTTTSPTDVYDGFYAAVIGRSASGSMEQTITVPTASSVQLEFYQNIAATPGPASIAGLEIYDTSGQLLFSPWSTTEAGSGYSPVRVDLSAYAGRTITLRFYVAGNWGLATLAVDNVRLVTDPWMYVTSNTMYGLLTRDGGGSYVDYTNHQWDSSGWSLDTDFYIPGPDGPRTLSYYSVDNSGRIENMRSYTVYKDDAPPYSALLINEPNVVTGGTELVTNGGFESFGTGWTYTGSATTTTTTSVSGIKSLMVGSTGVGSATYDVFIGPWVRPTLSFWHKANGVYLFNGGGVKIQDLMGHDLLTVYSASADADWAKTTVDLSAFKGFSVRLCFFAAGTAGYAPTMYFDNVSLVSDGAVYIPPANSQRIIAADNGVGVKSVDYIIDGTTHYTGTGPFTLSTPGLHGIHYYAADYLGNSWSLESNPLISVDASGPEGTVSINGGRAYTTSPTVTLSITASDPVGVSEMRIMNDAGELGPWQLFQPTVTTTLATTEDGTKVFKVMFRDVFGNVGPACYDTIEYRVPVSMDIKQVKKTADDKGVFLMDKVVTAVFPALGCFYVEEPTRYAGIRIDSPMTPALGSKLRIEGVTSTYNAEHRIVATNITPGGSTYVPAPFGMTNGNLGGSTFGYQPGIPGAAGLNNVGLLVRTAGRVTLAGTGGFYICDGSRLSDAYPDRNWLLVRSDALGSWRAPLGAFVTVTGISSIELYDTPYRLLMPRGMADIQINQLKALYIYGSDYASAMDYKNLLDSEGIPTDIVKYANLSADFSQYNVIIIGDDSGEWSDPVWVNTIVSSYLPVIATGLSGGKFLDAAPGLYIGAANSLSSTQIKGVAFGGSVYTYPHNLGVAIGSPVPIYTAGQTVYSVYDPTGITDRIIQQNASIKHFDVSHEGRFYQWGYSKSPSYMTEKGKQLLVNLIFSSVR